MLDLLKNMHFCGFSERISKKMTFKILRRFLKKLFEKVLVKIVTKFMNDPCYFIMKLSLYILQNCKKNFSEKSD